MTSHAVALLCGVAMACTSVSAFHCGAPSCHPSRSLSYRLSPSPHQPFTPPNGDLFLHTRPSRAANKPLMAVDLTTAAAAAAADGDILDAAGTAILNFMRNVPYGAIFAASLFPYLAFLRNIWRRDLYGMPEATRWGFASLIIFVTATIVASIVAKLTYSDELANVDYLHGVAESFLGLTNTLLALSAVRALEAHKRDNKGQRPERWRW